MAETPSAPVGARRPWRRLALSAACALFLTAAAVTCATLALRRQRTEVGDAQPASRAEVTSRQAVSPRRNAVPGVRYVGDAACARCHEDIAAAYREHPMGRSLAPVASALPVERLDAAAHNPFRAGGLEYRIEQRGDKVFHRELAYDTAGAVLAQIEAEVAYAVGSGERGRSYLLERDGFLFQSPITWYPQKQRWDLSPVYEVRNQHFGRPITPDCLFCHSNQVDPVPYTLNRYRTPVFRGHAIGCERCHGPGELHVARQESGEAYHGADDTVVNPGRLGRDLREAVCQQCHLQGRVEVVRRGRQPFDYRPGLSVEEFVTVFLQRTAPGERLEFVGHVEQMQASRCYEDGRLGCISCHDPHAKPPVAAKAAYYRQRCLNCHAQGGCRLPEPVRRARADDCTACHMPRGPSDVRHIAVTDHHIPRRPMPGGTAAEPGRLPPDGVPLTPFHPRPADDPETARDLGVALLALMERQPPALRRGFAGAALPRLEAAVARDPEDLPAREALGRVLQALQRAEEARAAFDAILNREPRHERALDHAANLAMATGRPADAAAYWRRALAEDPWRWQHHYGLAAALTGMGDWQAGVQACGPGLRLNPVNRELRQLLIRCLLEAGEADRAAAEFRRLLALFPGEREVLEQWFRQRRN